MLRCLAIDDEELALQLLADNIRKVPFLQLQASCHDPMEALHLLKQQSIDLVFLDIQMPGLTGLQFIQSLSQKPLFILITAYPNYALEGFNLDVVDYLVKPVSMERFLKACNKAQEAFHYKNTKPDVGEVAPTFFFVNADYSYLKIDFADIIWIEGLKDYVRIHLKNAAKPIVARLSMKGLEDQLPSSLFIRIQRSYIVSKAYITAVRKNSVFIDTLELPVGEQYKEAVLQWVGKQPE